MTRSTAAGGTGTDPGSREVSDFFGGFSDFHMKSIHPEKHFWVSLPFVNTSWSNWRQAGIRDHELLPTHFGKVRGEDGFMQTLEENQHIFSYDVIISNVSPGPLIYCISVVCLGPCVSSAVVLFYCVYINLHMFALFITHTRPYNHGTHGSAQFTCLLLDS